MPPSGQLPGLFSFLLGQIGRLGDKFAVRCYRFQFRMTVADPQDTLRDNQYRIGPAEERLVTHATFNAYTPLPATSLESGGTSPNLSRIDAVFRHETQDLLEPEYSYDLAATARPNFMDLSNHYNVIPYWDATANAVRYHKTASGVIPLMARCGPGGLFQFGGIKTLGAGSGEEWYVLGTVHTLKL